MRPAAHVTPFFRSLYWPENKLALADVRAESKIRQGVTTEVMRNCGAWPALLAGAVTEQTRAKAKGLGVDITWMGMAEYLDHVGDTGTALNVAPLLGHNTVQGAVLGFDDLQPTREQYSQMERLLQEAMEQGARGLLSGVYYAPGFYAPTGELTGLPRVVARRNGILEAEKPREEGQAARSKMAAAHLSTYSCQELSSQWWRRVHPLEKIPGQSSLAVVRMCLDLASEDVQIQQAIQPGTLDEARDVA